MLQRSQATDERLQSSQLGQQRASMQLDAMRACGIARANLDALNLRAPVAGKLSGFSIQIGQSLQRGERIGQIDSPGRNKLRPGSTNSISAASRSNQTRDGRAGTARPIRARVTKIYPQVQNGQFQVDLQFIGDEPAGHPARPDAPGAADARRSRPGPADPQRRVLQRYRRQLDLRRRARRRQRGEAPRSGSAAATPIRSKCSTGSTPASASSPLPTPVSPTRIGSTYPTSEGVNSMLHMRAAVAGLPHRHGRDDRARRDRPRHRRRRVRRDHGPVGLRQIDAAQPDGHAR